MPIAALIGQGIDSSKNSFQGPSSPNFGTQVAIVSCKSLCNNKTRVPCWSKRAHLKITR